MSVLLRKTGNDVYDFNFRNHFECKSVVSGIDAPVLLHIGAIKDYAAVEKALKEMGMATLISEEEHIRCSTIECWYPLIKDRTPFTKIYDELPSTDNLLQDFSFPVFIKGSRQTNHHKKSQCIIENVEAYEKLRDEWKLDDILSWQKAAVREYIPLQIIDEYSFPDIVPMSYEFRFFYFEGKCMAYGPYWYMGKKYALQKEDLVRVLELTDWASKQLDVPFLAIDVAKTLSGDWIVIEVNDAQESGFVGVNPIVLWNNIIEAMQNYERIRHEVLIPEGTVVMCKEPLPDISPKEMWSICSQLKKTQEIVNAFAAALNEFWWVEDNVYDYEEGTEDYKKACTITDEWKELLDYLEDKVVQRAKEEKLMKRDEKYPRAISSLSPIMEKYGYQNKNGWWVRMPGD